MKNLILTIIAANVIVIGIHEGTPITIKDIGNVTLGPDFRRGALDKEGREVTGE